MSEDDRLQYKFMIPAGLKERLEASAHEHRRSLSAEIISRLESTFEQFGPYTAIGMSALAKRLDANIEATEHLVYKLLYELRATGGGADSKDKAISDAVARYAAEHGLNKAHAVQTILEDWLTSHGLLDAEKHPLATPEGIRRKIDELEQSGHISRPTAQGEREKPVASKRAGGGGGSLRANVLHTPPKRDDID